VLFLCLPLSCACSADEYYYSPTTSTSTPTTQMTLPRYIDNDAGENHHSDACVVASRASLTSTTTEIVDDADSADDDDVGSEAFKFIVLAFALGSAWGSYGTKYYYTHRRALPDSCPYREVHIPTSAVRDHSATSSRNRRVKGHLNDKCQWLNAADTTPFDICVPCYRTQL
jgi:hypothetical protein